MLFRRIIVLCLLFMLLPVPIAADDSGQGIITFYGQRNDVYLLMIAQPQGGEIRRPFSDDRGGIVWSRDGKQMAYYKYNKLATGLPSGCFVMDLATQKSTLLVKDASCGQWSPDSKQFVAIELNGLALYDSQGQNRRLLVRHLFDKNNKPINYYWNPDWSPDGKQIVFDGVGHQITVADVSVTDADNNRRELALGQTPIWTPDGKHIIFSRDLGKTGRTELAIMDADGSNARTFVEPFGAVRADTPVWSPDHTHLIFIASMTTKSGGDSLLYMVDANGKNLRALPFPSSYYSALIWSPAAVTMEQMPPESSPSKSSAPIIDLYTEPSCSAAVAQVTNLRLSPSTSAVTIGKTEQGKSYPVDLQAKAGGTLWYRFTAGGWIRGDRAKLAGDCDKVPGL